MSNSRDFLSVGSGYRPDGCANSGKFRADAIHQAILFPICQSLLSLSCCARHEPVPLSSCRDRVTQVSVINALIMGRYDGVMPIPELLSYPLTDPAFLIGKP